VSATTETPSSDTIIPQPPILIIQPQQQTHDSTTITTLLEIPNFASLFGFERRVSSLEIELSELKQTNQFVEALSSIPGIVDNYLTSKMKDVVNVAIQLKSNKLNEETQAENDEFLKQIDSNIKAIFKDQEDSSKEATQKESKSTSSSKGASRSQPKSSGKSAQAEKHGPRVDDLEEPLHQEFNIGNDDISPVKEIIAFDELLWNPSVELEYHLEEVFKATNDQLDWHNPEGRPYPHDLSMPLPLIQNAQGRQTKAADYGHVKWIENKFHRSIWSPAQVVYDKHAYWGTYHWGPKRQRFYRYATNMETSKDVYSIHRIIVVTSLKIMELFGYKHLEEIIVRRQDNQLYRFREGDFKILRRQDIEDMLLLLVQGKLTNLNLDERFALNVALRMYTRRIVIQERVKDLQLAVESYQKKINLSRPDSYHLDL
ncbi:hypothetical protein Tco_1480100, partial [Tanacetum coccineum]